jgi:hypothetical protein
MEESVDYYFNEHGLMVFTAAYHLKRGYCCKNKCKHCPWNYGKEILQNASKLTINPSDKHDATEEGN